VPGPSFVCSVSYDGIAVVQLRPSVLNRLYRAHSSQSRGRLKLPTARTGGLSAKFGQQRDTLVIDWGSLRGKQITLGRADPESGEEADSKLGFAKWHCDHIHRP